MKLEFSDHDLYLLMEDVILHDKMTMMMMFVVVVVEEILLHFAVFVHWFVFVVIYFVQEVDNNSLSQLKQLLIHCFRFLQLVHDNLQEKFFFTFFR